MKFICSRGMRPKSCGDWLPVLGALLLANLHGCSRPVPVRMEGFTLRHFIDAAGEQRRLFMLAPQTVTGVDSRRASVIMFHGGGWTGGRPAELESMARELVERGFVVILPEYRASPQLDAPLVAAAHARAALNEIVEHAERWRLDLHRLVLVGTSAGGHVAYFAAMDSARRQRPVAGLVLLSGVVDTTAAGYGAELFSGPSMDWSPADQPDRRLPPVLIIHGTADDVTPFAGAARLQSSLSNLGVDAELMPLDGAGHGFYARTPLTAADAWLERVVEFVTEVTGAN